MRFRVGIGAPPSSFGPVRSTLPPPVRTLARRDEIDVTWYSAGPAQISVEVLVRRAGRWWSGRPPATPAATPEQSACAVESAFALQVDVRSAVSAAARNAGRRSPGGHGWSRSRRTTMMSVPARWFAAGTQAVIGEAGRARRSPAGERDARPSSAAMSLTQRIGQRRRCRRRLPSSGRRSRRGAMSSARTWTAKRPLLDLLRGAGRGPCRSGSRSRRPTTRPTSRNRPMVMATISSISEQALAGRWNGVASHGRCPRRHVRICDAHDDADFAALRPRCRTRVLAAGGVARRPRSARRSAPCPARRRATR